MRSWLERQLYLIDYTLAALDRRRARTIGMLMVYMLLVFVLASVMLFSHALRREMVRILEHAPEVVLQYQLAGRSTPIPASLVERIGRVRGVRKIEPRLWGLYFDAAVRANYTFIVDREHALADEAIVIGPALARTRGLEAGDKVSWRAWNGALHTFSVAAVLPQASELMSADLVLLSETGFRRFFGYPDDVHTDLALSVSNPREVRNVAAKLAELLPETRPILREEVLRTYAAIFDWREGIALAVLGGALLAFAILAWDRASGLSAEERREIGILKAIGWETGDVMRMKFWEGALLSSFAFLGGYLLAYLHVFHLGGALFRPVLQGWAVLYPRFTLVPEIDPLQVFTLCFLTVVPYTAAVLVPSWRAAITDPDTVMRA